MVFGTTSDLAMLVNSPYNDAEFQNQRAVGVFLVSAFLYNGKANVIKVTNEVGGVLKMILPCLLGPVQILISEK